MNPADPQSLAFRDATDTDHWDGNVETLVTERGATHHPPITNLAQIRLPGDYENASWDHGREGPKNPAQACAALAARIVAPTAPDTAAEAGAYDDLDG